MSKEPAIEFVQETMGDKALKALGGIVYGVGSIAFIVLWAAYVLTILWGWFILPIFPDAPVLTMMRASGLCLVVNLIIAKPDTSILEKIGKKMEEREQKDPVSQGRRIWEMVKSAFQKPAFALVTGWIIHQLILRGF